MKLSDAKLYGPGDRITKTKLILEALESAYEHKEQVPYDNLTIEHVMPQTLSEAWKLQLGEDWQMTHELYLHSLGNLTLTAYNSELSNEPYPKKRRMLTESHLELNQCFQTTEAWTAVEIEKRAMELSDLALKVWAYFGSNTSSESEPAGVVGKTPIAVWILGQRYDVGSWRDVLEHTMDTIADLEPEGFQRILGEFPRFVGMDKSKFRSVRELDCGAFVEVNLGSEAIYRFCCQAVEAIGLSSEDWRVDMGINGVTH